MINNNFLIILIGFILLLSTHSQQTYAELTKKYTSIAPLYTKSISNENNNRSTVYITAKNVIGKYPDFIEYKGNVCIKNGNQTLTANRAKLMKTKNINQNLVHKIIAEGDIHYNDSQIILNGIKVCFNLDSKDTDIDKSNYFMINSYGRGYADKIKLRNNNRYTILNNGMFTTCSPNNHSWNITGSKIILDREKEIIKIWDARFFIINIPILYSPYLQLPIGNKKHSGFLLPTNSYSKTLGLSFMLPYYWNIAPNYDLTITPEFINFRGIKLNNELRYLNTTGTGTVIINWLKNNQNYIKNRNNSNNNIYHNRWLLHYKHTGILNKRWSLNINYTRASDLEYFIDFNSKHNNTTNQYAIQKFSISYKQLNWNATLTNKQIQNFTNYYNNTYKLEPQLDFNFYINNYKLPNIKTYAQISRIVNSKKNNPNFIHLYIEPQINLPLSNKWININNTIKIVAKYYNRNISNNLMNNIKKRDIHILPLLTSNATTIFERNLLRNKNYLQTLEPKIQYTYMPYQNQNNINNYNIFKLETNYDDLFSHRNYNKFNSIASPNQLITEVTTRIYDKKLLVEHLNFSIGQIYCFKYPKIETLNPFIKNKNIIGSLLWTSNIYIRLTSNWKLYGELQYDKHLSNITIGNVATEYHLDSNYLVKLNYRFINHNYINATNKDISIFKEDISQIGILTKYSLNDKLRFINSYYYNFKVNQPTSWLVGLQYSTCCWSVNFGYEYNQIGWQQHNLNNIHDNKWSINVELKNLNNNINLKDHIATIENSCFIKNYQ